MAVGSKKKKAQDAWQKDLKSLYARLVTDDVIYFPIRHHSPACAWHVSRLIAEKKPASILIEGPEPLSTYIPELSKPDLVAPVALYSQYIERKKGEGALSARYGAFYPLCDYSPELAAIREGARIDAKVSFCDLDHARQVFAEESFEEEEEEEPVVARARSFFDERHLAQNRYLKELARRTGCRDTDELWDRLFESSFCDTDTEGFMRKVAAYCFFARRNAVEEELGRDGTHAREAYMESCIKKERTRMKRRKATGPLLVVTGGFHTPPLALKQVSKTQKALKEIDPEDVLLAILPYSFPQLDALNGYGAGMPSPRYYQQVWEAARNDGSADLERVSRELLVQLPGRTRELKLNSALSTADAIAAHQQACTLARFRGNPGPMREDMLDGIRSSFAKGALDVEGDAVLRLARELLCGEAIGKLPPGTRTHPLLEDFREQAGQLGLKLDSATPQPRALEIYKKPKHRMMAQFFRRLQFLGVPFARFSGGPDFLSGHGLHLRIQHWTYAWTPQVDSTLVDLTPKGTTILDAIATTLQERQAQLVEAGSEASSAEAVRILMQGFRLGLHDQARVFVPFVSMRLQEELNFEASVDALVILHRLCHVSSPLETRQLNEIPELLVSAYERSCYLVDSLPGLPEDREPAVLQRLGNYAELLAESDVEPTLDASLLWEVALSAASHADIAPGIAGGLDGLLFNGKQRTRAEITDAVRAQHLSADERGRALGRYLSGLLSQCRELTWSDSELIAVLTEFFSEWSEEEFYNALPDLRLAFAQHTPQEADRTGKLVARICGLDSIGDIYSRHIDEALASHGASVAAIVARSLKEDFLEGF